MSKVFVDFNVVDVQSLKNRHTFRKTKCYIKMRFDGRERKSPVIQTDLGEDPNITFISTLTFELDPSQIKDIPTMVAELDVMDKAKIGSDDSMGAVKIPLEKFELGSGEHDASFDLSSGGKVTLKIKVEKRAQ